MAEFSHKLSWTFGIDINGGIAGFAEDGGEGLTTFGLGFPNVAAAPTPACEASLLVPDDPPEIS